MQATLPVTTFPNLGSASTLGNVQLHYRPGVLQIPGDGHNALRDLAASYAQFREAAGAAVPGVVVLKRTADVTAWLFVGGGASICDSGGHAHAQSEAARLRNKAGGCGTRMHLSCISRLPLVVYIGSACRRRPAQPWQQGS